MSDYYKRYEVHSNRQSYYTDSAQAVLDFIAARPGATDVWVAEGYADEVYDYPREGVTMVTRRQIGPVSLTEIEFRAARERVASMIKTLKGAA